MMRNVKLSNNYLKQIRGLTTQKTIKKQKITKNEEFTLDKLSNNYLKQNHGSTTKIIKKQKIKKNEEFTFVDELYMNSLPFSFAGSCYIVEELRENKIERPHFAARCGSVIVLTFAYPVFLCAGGLVLLAKMI